MTLTFVLKLGGRETRAAAASIEMLTHERGEREIPQKDEDMRGLGGK